MPARCLIQPSPEAATIEWVVDVLAEELAALPQIERRHLIQRLSDRAGYGLADDLVGGHNQRIALVERLAAHANLRSG